MSADLLLALTALAFATCWTPGPNNIMLANSGATFGYRATVAHAQGVALGFPLMLFVIALGLGEIFRDSAALREALRWAGAALMLWLGWRIGTAGRAQAEGRARPFTFVEAAAFQWVNPKAWIMALSTAALAGADDALFGAVVAAGVFVLAGLTSAHGWALFGAALRRFLSTDRRLRVFNAAMGLSVALSAVYLAAAEI